ncbi:MAG: hypothetical protein Fur0022_08810 [Anaerolineales bacterium]
MMGYPGALCGGGLGVVGKWICSDEFQVQNVPGEWASRQQVEVLFRQVIQLRGKWVERALLVQWKGVKGSRGPLFFGYKGQADEVFLQEMA